jgi:hypothetical protein
MFDWQVSLGGRGLYSYGAVIGRNGIVYVVDCHFEFHYSILSAFDPTGNLLWRDDTLLGEGEDLVIDGRDRIIVTDPRNGCLYCYNPDGALAWVAEGLGYSYSAASAVGLNDLVVTACAGLVTCFDSAGRRQWTSSGHVGDGTTPCIAQDGSIIAYNPDDGYVCAIDPQGSMLWEFSIWDSLGIDNRARKCSDGAGLPSPVIGTNGDLYLAGYDGIFCLSGANLHLASTAWPTYNHDNARSGWAGRQ